MNSTSTTTPALHASTWYAQGQQDAQDGRFDPPANPDDRAAYESGYHATKELTP